MRKILAFILILFTIYILPIKILAIECDSNPTSNEIELEQKIIACQQKVTNLKTQSQTLSSQIQYMNSQIYLKTLKIQETEEKISKTTSEIEKLGEKIEGLDTALNSLINQWRNRVADSYKKRTDSLSFINIILDSDNVFDLFNQYKYLKTAQENNRKILIQVQSTKQNFEDQKKLREDKKKQLDDLNIILAQQKIELNSQKISKEKLLSDTKNDEKTYQTLLTQAQQQLSAFKSFVSTSGANTVIGSNELGNGSDGNYYSQRDSRWAYKTIGYSSENILNVGCLLTSVSMLLKKHWVDMSPQTIASTVDYFWANTAYMNYRWNITLPNGLRGYSLNISEIDNELNNGNYVIVGIGYSGCSGGGDHYVVLTKKDGNDYKMHDPIYGPDQSFNSHYSLLCSAETIK